MRTLNRPIKWSRVLIDICTQRDYLDSGAILQVANHDKFLPRLREVFLWAKNSSIPIVSIVESHRPTEPYNGFPLHCIDGTPGQEKLPFTLLNPWTIVENDNYLSLPPDLQKNYRQLIFRKRTREILSNPKTDRFLTSCDAAEFIVVGVGLERSIKTLVLGLLARHKQVTVVSDACGCWSVPDADLSCRQLAAKGTKMITAAELVASQPMASSRSALARRRLRDRRHPAGGKIALRARSRVGSG